MQKIALITGSSRGIGAAIAQQLAKDGYAVCINYHKNADRAQKLVQEIKQGGGQAIAVAANMSKEAEILNLFESIDKQLGPLTALVNNAGTNGGIGTVEEVTWSRLEEVFTLNVFAAFICSREAVKRMKKVGKGSIVNISSEAARFGGNKLAAYAASKSALNTFTLGFAREVASDNIRVNVVSPGVIDTEMHHNSPADRIEALIKSLPMGRMGKAEEVAHTVAWLLSDQASYLSGAIIPVAGGR